MDWNVNFEVTHDWGVHSICFLAWRLPSLVNCLFTGFVFWEADGITNKGRNSKRSVLRRHNRLTHERTTSLTELTLFEVNTIDPWKRLRSIHLKYKPSFYPLLESPNWCAHSSPSLRYHHQWRYERETAPSTTFNKKKWKFSLGNYSNGEYGWV